MNARVKISQNEWIDVSKTGDVTASNPRLMTLARDLAGDFVWLGGTIYSNDLADFLADFLSGDVVQYLDAESIPGRIY